MTKRLRRKFINAFLFGFIAIMVLGLLIFLGVVLFRHMGGEEVMARENTYDEVGSGSQDGGIFEDLTEEEMNASLAAGEDIVAPVSDPGSGQYSGDSESMTNMSVAPSKEDPYGYQVTPSKAGQVTFTFAGDILFDERYAMMNRLYQNGGRVEGVMGDSLLHAMRGSDVMMLNNEFPYTDGSQPIPDKKYTFRAKTKTAQFLRDMGVDCVSLANNHAFDYGEQGLMDSLSTLQGAGIPYIGAGRNIEEASHPLIFNSGDLKIAVVAATQIERMQNPSTREAGTDQAGVFRCYDDTALLQKIREAKEMADYCVVFVHWGTEKEKEIDWAQEAQAPEMVASGADLIIGAHPHVLQKIDYVSGVPVVYSLGNFWFNSHSRDTGMVTATFHKEGISLRFLPVIQEDCAIRLADPANRQRIIGGLNALSTGAVIGEDGQVMQK